MKQTTFHAKNIMPEKKQRKGTLLAALLSHICGSHRLDLTSKFAQLAFSILFLITLQIHKMPDGLLVCIKYLFQGMCSSSGVADLPESV